MTAAVARARGTSTPSTPTTTNSKVVEARDPSPSKNEQQEEPWDEPPSLATPQKQQRKQPQTSNNSLVNMVAGTMNCGWNDQDEDELEDGDLPSLSRKTPPSKQKQVLLSTGQKTTRPLKTPSRAGMPIDDEDSPQTWEEKQKFWSQLDVSGSEDSLYNQDDDEEEGPDDEVPANYKHRAARNAPRQQDEVTLDTNELERVESDDDPGCFEYTLASLGNICGTGNDQSPPKVKRQRVQDDDDEEDEEVEEQTAIEVEYVGSPNGPKSSEAAMTWSPTQKNAYLAAMARKAKADFEKKEEKGGGKQQRGDEPASRQLEEGTGETPHVNDLYNSLSAPEKRKFLKLLNSGVTPTESLRRVMEERAQKEAMKQAKSPDRKNRFSFWKKKGTKERSRSQDARGGAADDGTPRSVRRSKSVETPKRNAAIAAAGTAAAVGTAAAIVATGSSDYSEYSSPVTMETSEVREEAESLSLEADAASDVGVKENPSEVAPSDKKAATARPAAKVAEADTAAGISPAQSREAVGVDASPSSQDDEEASVSELLDQESEEQEDVEDSRAKKNRAVAAVVGAGAVAAAGVGAAAAGMAAGKDRPAKEEEDSDEVRASGSFVNTGLHYYDAIRKDFPEDDDEGEEEQAPPRRSRAAGRAARLAKLRSPRTQGFSSLHESKSSEAASNDLASPRGRQMQDDDVRSTTMSPTRRQIFGIPFGSSPSGFAVLKDDDDAKAVDYVEAARAPPQDRPLETDDQGAALAAVAGVAAVAANKAPEESGIDESAAHDVDESSDLANEKDREDDDIASRIEKELLRPVALETRAEEGEEEESEKDDSVFEMEDASSPKRDAGTGELDTSLDTYMDAATVHSYSSNAQHDHMSVVSGRSARTHGTGTSTLSTRKRHHGAAKTRIAKAKESERLSKSKGWHESIREAAEKNHRVWDPARGWVDYEDVQELMEPTPSSKEKLSVSLDKVALGRNHEQADDEGRSVPGERVEVPFPGKWQKERDAMLGKSQAKSSEGIDENPNAWAESMAAVTAKMDTGDKKWDPERGWVDKDVTGAGQPVSGNKAAVVGGTAAAAVTAGALAATIASRNQEEKNEKSSLTAFIDKSTKTKKSGAERSIDASDQAVASGGGAEKYVQIGDTGSVRSVAHDGQAAASMRAANLNILAEKVAAGEMSAEAKKAAPQAETSKDTLDSSAFSTGSRRSSGPVDIDEADQLDSDEEEDTQRAPAVQVVKEKCDEDDISLFAQDEQSMQPNASLLSAASSGSRRGRGPVDIDDADDLTSDDEEEEGSSWAPGSFTEGNSTSEMFEKVRQTAIPPKLMKNKRDTSPIRDRWAKGTPVAGTFKDEGKRDGQSRSVRTEHSAADSGGSSVKLRAQQWESIARSNSTDNHDKASPEVSWPTPTDAPRNQKEGSAGTAEWKSFLGKKVMAESVAAASKGTGKDRREPEGVRGSEHPRMKDVEDIAQDESYDDSLFEFYTDEVGVQTLDAATPTKVSKSVGPDGDFANLSPIPKKGEDDSQLEKLSDTGTAAEQGTFMKRLQACAAPMMPKQFAQSNKPGEETVPSSHLAFLRSNPSSGTGTGGSRGVSRFVPPALCGRPDTISEVDDDDEEGTPQKSAEDVNRQHLAAYLTGISKEASQSRSKRSKSNPRSDSRRVDSDNRSVSSEDFGARSSYLEAIAMKTAVSKPRKKSSASSDISSGSRRTQEKWQKFLNRRGSSGASPTNSQARSSSEVSKAAERYAAEKVEEMMQVMASRSKSAPRSGRASLYDDKRDSVDDMIETLSAGGNGAGSPTPGDARSVRSEGSARSRSKKKSESAKAAEELAAARVEAMMAAMTASTLDEGEI